MIEKIDQIAPVPFSQLAPGEYFGVILDGSAGGRTIPKASRVWRCQKLSGPGARFRILFGDGLFEKAPGDGQWATRHLPRDFPVHRYPGGIKTRSDEPNTDEEAIRLADGFVDALVSDTNTDPDLVTAGTEAVLSGLASQMTAHLRAAAAPGFLFVHLCGYSPSYNPDAIDPDDTLCHVRALACGLGNWAERMGDGERATGNAILAAPFLSTVPELETMLLVYGGHVTLETLGLDRTHIKKAIDRLARTDQPYRQLRTAADRVLRGFRRWGQSPTGLRRKVLVTVSQFFDQQGLAGMGPHVYQRDRLRPPVLQPAVELELRSS